MGPSKPPTVAEKKWMDRVRGLGCIVCWNEGLPTDGVVPAIHHMVVAGRRLGHRFVLPLCDPGHHQNGAPMGMISRHPNKAAFEYEYGPEGHLLEIVKERLGVGVRA